MALWIALAICPPAYALNPLLDVNQYAHTSWTVRDGVFDGSVTAIAQTPDGYLWVGTEFGLVRFDGVRFAPWEPPKGAAVSGRIRGEMLLAARDGSLWIDSYPGIVRLKDGRLYRYPSLDAPSFLSLAEDPDGRIWLGSSYNPAGQLCVVDHDQVRCSDTNPTLGTIGFAGSVFVDAPGRLWLAGHSGLALWEGGAPRTFPLAFQPSAVRPLIDEGRALLVSTPGGIARFKDGDVTMAYPSPSAIQPFTARVLLRDRDGGIWMGTVARGVVHFHGGSVEVFNQANGLSGDVVLSLFEDREGSIWVATTNGLDRFSDRVLARYSSQQGLSNTTVASVVAGRDHSMWVATQDGLNRFDGRQLTIYRARHQPTLPGVREIVGDGLPPAAVESLFEDSMGRLWVATPRGVGYLNRDRVDFVPGLSDLNTSLIGEDRHHDIWTSQQGTVTRVRGDRIERIPLGVPGSTVAISFAAAGDAVWLGLAPGGLLELVDGRVRTRYSAADGLGQGRVSDLRAAGDGTVWAATEGGLSRIQNGRIATLTSHNGLPCDGVHWSIEDDVGSTWLYMPCGLVRVSNADLAAWAASVDAGGAAKAAVRAATFRGADGVPLGAQVPNYQPHVAKDAEGRIWFGTADGVAVLDPRNVRENKLPPPVHIETVVADRHTHVAAAGLRLPPRVRDLQIGYTALSFVAPEKNQFRVKLEGRDRDWEDVGTRRQAFYTDLGPGTYRFRVIGSNNRGVWNETGASLDFSIAPAYYQTRWFAAAVVAMTIALLWVAYQLRVAQLARQFNRTLEARVSERTRIARDLHDTLLQSLQGLLLQFQSASNLIRTRPDEAQTRLDRALDQAEAALTEGRDAVQGLRASAVTVNDLANGIAAVGADLTSDPSLVSPPVVAVEVDGASRDLNPVVREEAYRIATEAVRNAVKHAQARRIAVTIHYEPRQLRLTVRDDGRGMDPDTIRSRQREGHFGLPGMRERAAIVNGRLEVISEPGAGTHIELRVPASIAYGKAGASRWRRFRR